MGVSPELRKLFVAAFIRFLNKYRSNSVDFRWLIAEYELRDKHIHDSNLTMFLKDFRSGSTLTSLFIMLAIAPRVAWNLFLLQRSSKALIKWYTQNIAKKIDTFQESENELYECYKAFCETLEFREIFDDDEKLHDAFEEFYEQYFVRFLGTSYEEIELLKDLLKKSSNTPLSQREFFQEIEKLLLTEYSVPVPNQILKDYIEKTLTLKEALDETYPLNKSKSFFSL